MPYPGGVENEEVSRRDQGGDIAAPSVFQASASAMDDQQSALVAPGQRVLGDQLGRELIVEVGSPERHASKCTGARYSGDGESRPVADIPSIGGGGLTGHLGK